MTVNVSGPLEFDVLPSSPGAASSGKRNLNVRNGLLLWERDSGATEVIGPSANAYRSDFIARGFGQYYPGRRIVIESDSSNNVTLKADGIILEGDRGDGEMIAVTLTNLNLSVDGSSEVDAAESERRHWVFLQCDADGGNPTLSIYRAGNITNTQPITARVGEIYRKTSTALLNAIYLCGETYLYKDPPLLALNQSNTAFVTHSIAEYTEGGELTRSAWIEYELVDSAGPVPGSSNSASLWINGSSLFGAPPNTSRTAIMRDRQTDYAVSAHRGIVKIPLGQSRPISARVLGSSTGWTYSLWLRGFEQGWRA